MDTSWVIASAPSAAEVAALKGELDLPPAFARLLRRRGFTDAESADRFLRPSLDHLGDPFALAGVTVAVERIERAIASREHMLVHGDYDVDGTTATALLVRVLRDLGADVDYFIPHRMEDGYGLSNRAIDAAVEQGVSLILTADCGIGAAEPVRHAKARGVDVIVTDHHELSATMPDAVSVINPKRPDCQYGFDAFAGVGVAFKLLQALVAHRGVAERRVLEDNLDLVALGTIADVVPLVGENRVLATLGLAHLARSQKLGVRALIASAGLEGRVIDSMHVAFSLAPRINAAGRLGDSKSSVQLFLSSDEDESRQLAQALERTNLARRRLDERILDEANEMLNEHSMDESRPEPIVLWSETWHSGVLGIVASKLVERFRLPTFLIALDEGEGRGSGRSVPGFDLVATLAECAAHLDTWGGHKYAAGLSLHSDRIEKFAEAFRRAGAAALAPLDRRPVLAIEEVLSFDSVTRGLADLCERLAPFGYENEEPVYAATGLQLADAPSRLGEHGQHLRILAYQDGLTQECIGFGMGEHADDISRPGQRFSMAFVPTVNRHRGRESVQLKIRDLKPD